jgi:hypothetical protein
MPHNEEDHRVKAAARRRARQRVVSAHPEEFERYCSEDPEFTTRWGRGNARSRAAQRVVNEHRQEWERYYAEERGGRPLRSRPQLMSRELISAVEASVLAGRQPWFTPGVRMSYSRHVEFMRRGRNERERLASSPGDVDPEEALYLEYTIRIEVALEGTPAPPTRHLHYQRRTWRRHLADLTRGGSPAAVAFRAAKKAGRHELAELIVSQAEDDHAQWVIGGTTHPAIVFDMADPWHDPTGEKVLHSITSGE